MTTWIIEYRTAHGLRRIAVTMDAQEAAELVPGAEFMGGVIESVKGSEG